MITNFEDYTYNFTELEEKTIIPILVKVLQVRVGKKNAIKNPYMVAKLAEMGHKTSEPRIRKMIHYIRNSGLVVLLMATQKGYYISRDKEEIKTYIETLHQRIDSIQMTIDQFEFQKKELDK